MSKLLFDEEPLVVQPSLAKLIGLNEAIIVQQLHYWLRKSKHEFEGRTWVYNTYADWQEQFPFWSKRTLERLIPKLQKDGLIIPGNFNKAGFDNTKWYTLDYDLLESLRDRVDDTAKVAVRSRQSGGAGTANVSSGDRQPDEFHTANLSRPIPENIQRLTPESNTENKTPPPTIAQAREAAEVIWNRCKRELETKISRASYETWFKTVKPSAYESKVLILEVVDDFNRDWLESKYSKTVKEILDKLAKDDITVRFILASGEGQAHE